MEPGRGAGEAIVGAGTSAKPQGRARRRSRALRHAPTRGSDAGKAPPAQRPLWVGLLRPQRLRRRRRSGPQPAGYQNARGAVLSIARNAIHFLLCGG